MSIIKTYNVKVHRKISESILVKERPRDSIINLEATKDKKIDYKDELYTTKLISVVRHKDRTEIKSNTLALKISNKKINNTWLYNYIIVDVSISPEDLGIFEYLVEDEGSIRTIYFNSNSNVSFINYLNIDYLIYPCVLINNSIDKSDLIMIDRNKDHILITINTSETYNVELISNYLFYPKIYNNTLEFYECVFKYNEDYFHLYTHTLVETLRQEYVSLGNNLKRPIYRKNTTYYNLNWYTYNSYNSNLLYLTSNLDVCYFYLKLNSNDISNIIIIKDKLVQYSDMVLLFTINNTSKIDRLNINPLYTNTINKPIGENVVFNDKTLCTSKYSDIQNIPLGKTLYNITIEDVVNGYKNTLLVENNTIAYGGDNTLVDLPTFDITTLTNVPTKYQNYSSVLDNKLKLVLGVKQ